jgi:hypothetical protein
MSRWQPEGATTVQPMLSEHKIVEGLGSLVGLQLARQSFWPHPGMVTRTVLDGIMVVAVVVTALVLLGAL